VPDCPLICLCTCMCKPQRSRPSVSWGLLIQA